MVLSLVYIHVDIYYDGKQPDTRVPHWIVVEYRDRLMTSLERVLCFHSHQIWWAFEKKSMIHYAGSDPSTMFLWYTG